MKTITFVPPTGNDILNPSADHLRDLIFNMKNDYWQSNAGDAGLWYDEDNSRKANLILTANDLNEFRVSYQSYQGDNQDYVLISEPTSNEEITLFVGGEPVSYPKSQFVPQNIAWEAIKEFLHSGEPAKNLKWKAN